MSPETETPPPPTPVPPSPSRPRLERPREDRVLGGVAAGIARHLGIDATLVRIGVFLLAFAGGAGVVAYLAGLLLIPAEGEERPILSSGRLDDDRTPFILGALLLAAIVVGTGPSPWGGWDGGGWLVVLVVGGLLVWLATRTGGADAADLPAAPAVPDADRDQEPRTAEMPPSSAPEPADADAPAQRRPRLAAGATLLVLGGVGLVLTAAGADVPVDLALALAVLCCGAVALVLAPLGGARGVVVLGFVLAVVSAIVAVTDIELRGGVGERTERPARAASIPDEPYRVAVGSLVIDLRETELPPGSTEVEARAGVGEIVVRTPPDVTVVARARAGLGEVEALGFSEDGGGAEQEAVSTRRVPTRLVVDARVGLGSVRILQTGTAEERG